MLNVRISLTNKRSSLSLVSVFTKLSASLELNFQFTMKTKLKLNVVFPIISVI